MTTNIRKTICRCVVTTLALTPLLFATSPAGAQEDGRAIEEIIVTAEKRSESVQDIGLSITALDTDAMAQFGITDVRRLGFAVAGLVYADAGNDAKFNVRGANSTNTFRDNASIVGAYVDGVYKAKASQQTRAFFDVERLEFLKGPQGTLYGRNTFAGALNVYTFKPDTDGVAGGITTSFERYNTQRTEGFINLPVSDTTAVRVAGYSEQGDGYIENSAGQNAGAPKSLGLRLSALMAPTDNLDFLFRAAYVQEKGTAAGLFGYALTCRNTDANGITDAFGSVTDCQNPNRGTFAEPRADRSGGGPYQIEQDFLPDHDLSETMFSLEINWDAGPVMVKSITSYTDFENEIPFDFDFSPTNASIGGFDEYVESVTQEFNVSSNYDSAFQWTAGAYYSNDDYFNTFWIYNPVRADNSVRPVDPATGLTVLDGTPLVSTAIDINGEFGDSNWVEATVAAVFAQGEFSVSDNLRLIAGIRQSEEDKDAHGGGSNFTANGPVTFIATETNGTYPQTRLGSFSFDEFAPGSNVIARSYSNTSWKAGIEWDLNDDMMFYFTGSTGFLSGSLNNDGTSTDEQDSEMYEVGIKSVLMDGTLLFNLAGHMTEYTNLVAQLQTIEGGVAITTTRNGGDIDANGIDVELQWVPTDEWMLGFTLALLDAEYGEFGQTSPYQLNRGVPTVFESQAGTTPGWSPELMANFNAAYTFSFANGGTLTPAIMIAYSGEYDTSNLYTPDPLTQQDAFTKTDLRLIWDSPNGNYTVSAYIENLEDEAVLSRSNNGSQDHIQTGFLYPQNYGISFQARW